LFFIHFSPSFSSTASAHYYYQPRYHLRYCSLDTNADAGIQTKEPPNARPNLEAFRLCFN
jgi:hypothetical protein